ncbi:CBN-CPG-4 protein [Caenorhabditis brenneri]|uniref:CBN-CPG-4 protein n=1 Tax=Caenorhabditis brenneri TaxID=135651 RepID=G0MXM8_CAEBE|nr:CBN-CPG-4 protein [Caenorhabditis brenneri]
MLRGKTLILFLFFIFLSHSQPIPTVSTDTANAYLRSFLPWWPNNTEFSLKTATIPPVSTKSTDAIQTLLGSEERIDNNTTLPDEGEEVDPATLRVQDIPSSPLDELRPDAAPKSFISDSISRNDGNFIIDFDEMGECPRDCSSDLREAMNIVLQDMSHVERYHRICEKYLNASTCVNEDARCDKDDRGMFEMMTSGLHYMCVEQELAFNATIKCIDDEAGLVQSECDAQCQTKNLFMNWMMRTAFQDRIQQGVSEIVGAATGTNSNPLSFLQGVEGAAGGTPTGWADMLATAAQRPPSPQDAQQGFENFRQFTNDLCRIGDCMLDCIRSKFNTRCEGSAGTLLSEVFVRPIAAGQNKLSILRPVLGSFMPEQCNYLHNNADLKKHRIDATMDEELKRMYAEKLAKEIRDRTQQDEILSNLVPLDKNGVPLPRALPELKAIDSPLDISVKTLDQLILDMYSKNETKAMTASKRNNVTTNPLEQSDEELTMNSTLTNSSEIAGSTTGINAKTVEYEILEKHLSDASGDGSAEEGSTENPDEMSGEVALDEEESSGSSSVFVEETEASGSRSDASGDGSADNIDIEMSGEMSSGSGEENNLESSGGTSFESGVGDNPESSGETSSGSGEEDILEPFGEASGSVSDLNDKYEKSIKNFDEASAEEEPSEFSGSASGESSGDYETSGQENISLAPVSDDTYNM